MSDSEVELSDGETVEDATTVEPEDELFSDLVGEPEEETDGSTS